MKSAVYPGMVFDIANDVVMRESNEEYTSEVSIRENRQFSYGVNVKAAIMDGREMR